MAGQLMKGAFVKLGSTMLSSLANVIVFQLNPETIRHTWSQPEPASWEPGANPLAVRGMPGESFSFSLFMDATDEIAAADAMVANSGVYARLAALETLLFPTDSNGDLLASGGGGSDERAVPASQISPVLFVWGPGRILPVRVTSLSITETLYDPSLNPTHAEAQIELRVLTPNELQWLTGPAADIANAAYAYSQGLRQTLTTMSLANAAKSITGMIPPSILQV